MTFLRRLNLARLKICGLELGYIMLKDKGRL